MESRTIDLDGPVHYADFGGTGPTMVLVHGLGGSFVDWTAVGPDLAERARVVAPALAGFGNTPLDGRSASVEANRDFLDRFIEVIASEPVALVGNSMGGLISILEAAANPERVAAMVLVDPAVPPVPGEPLDPVTEQLFTAYDTPGIGESFLRLMVEALGLEETFDQMMAYICADATRIDPRLREQQLAMARERLAQPWADQAFLEAARSLLDMLWHDPSRFWEALDRAATPTLLLEGELDRLVLVGAAREIARRRPDWTLRVIPGIGHVPMMEDPAGVVAMLTNWLEEQGFLEATAAASRPSKT
jgi:pimeloyl-ACP methyl ester carboxylesterase